jgi:hypothetical protein
LLPFPRSSFPFLSPLPSPLPLAPFFPINIQEWSLSFFFFLSQILSDICLPQIFHRMASTPPTH